VVSQNLLNGDAFGENGGLDTRSTTWLSIGKCYAACVLSALPLVP